MNKQTAVEWLIEKVDEQISTVQNSMKGRDAKYKYAADASITNLVVVKMGLKQAIDIERTQTIEFGLKCLTGEYIETIKGDACILAYVQQRYLETFKKGSK
jgi:hypothetical protein